MYHRRLTGAGSIGDINTVVVDVCIAWNYALLRLEAMVLGEPTKMSPSRMRYLGFEVISVWATRLTLELRMLLHNHSTAAPIGTN